MLSVLIIGIFGALALACDDDDSPPQPPNCLDPAFVTRETVDPPVTSALRYFITVLDKETNKPVKGIYIKAHWNGVYCKPLQSCPEQCTMEVDILGSSAEHFTDDAGKIDGVTFPYDFSDKKDRLLIAFDVEDLQGVYVPKRISLRYDYATTTHTYTTYLIKNDAL